ncbi:MULTISPECIES: hypothetical protein [unclassified Haladaptatus]|uniref:hypothetical protein n=1 Tax=unclassified Haladaptatus TaxID=2622732 RepID=UPI00209C0192|nr:MULTISPECIES: hypothetical protein [unclassified Haladaptatus]MCO8246954.1 hypothetical protein [Haladaptatus sp. AB643]MCO8253518.1 hypothetical protein [Haladaptatus sp. AB618]
MIPRSRRARTQAWAWVYATLFEPPEKLDDDAGDDPDELANDRDVVSEGSAESR